MSDNDQTRAHRPASPDETQAHQPVRPAGPDPDATQVHQPVKQPDPPPFVPPAPPAPAAPQPPPPRHDLTPARYARQKRRAGLLRTVFVSALKLALVAGLVLGTAAVVYMLFPPPRTNILLLGVDSRPGEGFVTRTDTIMLVTVDARQPYVGMLSIPRDTYVQIPGYNDGRINTAHILGEQIAPGEGPKLAARTITQNFGVPVHHTARINFNGFVEIVDAAGGVEIEVTRSLYDDSYPTSNYGVMTVSFEPGVVQMDGATALIYARTRHSTNDFDRAARQQQVMVALARKMSNPGNWWRWPAVYSAIVRNVDTDMTLLDMTLIAPAMLRVGPQNFDRIVMSRENSMVVNANVPGDLYLLAPNWSLVSPVIEAMFGQ